MRYREWAGKKVSVLALGTTDFGGKTAEGTAHEYMDAYAALGGNFIDTALLYGDFAHGRLGECEKVIGRWLVRRDRSKIFLSTKGAHPDLEHMDRRRCGRDDILGDIRCSLENLRTDCVDIYWLHRDEPDRPVGDILETLNLLVDSGMTRLIGVSNWSMARIREMNDYAAAHGLRPLDADQPQFSLARQMIVEDPTLVSVDADLWRYHAETGMPLAAFSSQAKGFLTKLHTVGAEGLPDKARRRFLSPENLATYERVLEVQAETGYTVGAIALAWLTCQPFPVYPICGASRLEHVEALAEAGDATLTDAQRDYLFNWAANGA